MNSVSTKKGDLGKTSLMFGRRVSKDSIRVCTYGSIDELSSTLRFARTMLKGNLKKEIFELQKNLTKLMTELATDKKDFLKLKENSILSESDLDILDQKILKLESKGLKFKEWIPEKDSTSRSILDIARTQCRRAERYVVALNNKKELARPFPIKYLNRLSDLIWLWSLL